MQAEQLRDFAIKCVEDIKGHDITTLDVRTISSITDYMVIASGNSNRQVAAIAKHLVEEAKHNGNPPLGTEGENAGEWVLVDLGDVVVHIMQPAIRDFYQLEKLWGEMDSEVAAVS
jgi:ribosome-associated protein